MLVKIRNKFAQEAIISVKGFSLSNWSTKQLELYFDVLPDNTLQQLMTLIGLRQSNYSKAAWVMHSDDVSHISSNSY